MNIYLLEAFEGTTLQVVAASDNYDVVKSILLNNYDPNDCKITVYDSLTGSYIKEIPGPKIAKKEYRHNILYLPHISFEKFVENHIKGESLVTKGIDFSMRLYDALEDGYYDVAVFEEDNKINKIEFFFSGEDYLNIIKCPNYMDKVINKKCNITIDDSCTPYPCGSVRFKS